LGLAALGFVTVASGGLNVVAGALLMAAAGIGVAAYSKKVADSEKLIAAADVEAVAAKPKAFIDKVVDSIALKLKQAAVLVVGAGIGISASIYAGNGDIEKDMIAATSTVAAKLRNQGTSIIGQVVALSNEEIAAAMAKATTNAASLKSTNAPAHDGVRAKLSALYPKILPKDQAFDDGDILVAPTSAFLGRADKQTPARAAYEQALKDHGVYAKGVGSNKGALDILATLNAIDKAIAAKAQPAPQLTAPDGNSREPLAAPPIRLVPSKP
jgi:hypothetical protein